MGGKTAFTLAIVALAALLLLTTTCTPQGEVEVGAQDNGGQIEAKVGDVLIVKLDANPSTGYAWEAVDLDGKILAQKGEVEFQQAKTEGEPLVGAGGTQVLRYDVLATGETELKLVYHRSFEPDVEPLQTFSVRVVVK